MALDVKPLSPVRRMLMILLMGGLLALSLGFAEVLIQRHGRPEVLRVRFGAPAGLADMPVNTSAADTMDGVLREGVVKWPQGERHVHAFDLPEEEGVGFQEYLQALLDRVLPGPFGGAISLKSGELGGVPGVEAERQVERGEDSSFAIIRMASVEGHIVAFCLSGEGLITDADKTFFDTYCTQQVEIHLERSGRKAP